MNLKIGSKGDDVKKLQEKLKLSVDGVFGPNTEKVVKEFQSKNGLTADGIVGPMTWEKIMGKGVVSTPQVAPQVSSVNLSKLKGQIPDSVLSEIPMTMEKFKIDTPIKLSHFLAQCAHESGGFKVVQENLNYSTDGLLKTFPKYFKDNNGNPDKVLAESYQKQPEKIASRVYGGRMGNGNEPTKEGWKFRGRGYIQLTGKENYISFGKSINEDVSLNPDLVGTKYPLLSAAWFFSKNCLSKCVDASDTCVTNVTKCVNGGTNGLDDRLNYFKKYIKLLS